jgi:hypothetical protein
MYNVTYINKIEQFGHIYCTVLIDDQNYVYPEIRIDKQYADSVTEDFLTNDCINDVYTYNQDIIDDTDLNIDFSGILD